MHPVETYLSHLAQLRSTGGGVGERSYYGPLQNLLDDIGGKLKPKVRCVPELMDTGAGHPDFGLYTTSQFQRTKDNEPLPGQMPERGAVEVKSFEDNSLLTARGNQVSKYWDRYGFVLVTNYWYFVIVARGDEGKPTKLETFRLADDKRAFLAMLEHPQKAAKERGDRLVDFLKRAMLHAAPISAPEDLAWFLASYAREARGRVEDAGELRALSALRNALEEALGLAFEGDKGTHLFQATLVQTLFYGVFSSWVLWARQRHGPGERFNWHEAAWTLHVPMIASLFQQIATPQRLKPLGVYEVLDWAGLVLNRVDRNEFFARFDEEHAVQYFYEPFLKAYDAELRKEYGVWYTPPEIVTYQVERIDRVLRDELGLPDGLADEQVVVLDPCCGTGAYLVEVLRRIRRTLEQKGSDGLMAQRLKRAAIERIFGFEIMPAPFVVAHLQLGLVLRHAGAPLKPDSDERVGVYLTNALTGWEPIERPKNMLPFPELMEERDAADKVKQEARILVILGNPPYNAFAGTSPEEEGGLVEPYKEGLTTPVEQGGWGIKKFNLDDLYVRFFRIAERRVVKSGKGVVSFISNYSWTSEPSFVVMRQRLLESFDKFWIDNMHGNRKISEYAPDGRTSETIFAIPGFSAGIQQGVVISLWVKRGDKQQKRPTVLYRDDIDAAKAVERRQQLLDSLRLKHLDRRYEKADPTRANRYSFRPSVVSSEYLTWPRVADIPSEPSSNGLMEKRGGALIDMDRDTLAKRMSAYYDRSVGWNSFKNSGHALATDAARYDASTTRTKALSAESFSESRLRRYALRPFDSRWCYYTPLRPIWNEPRPAYWGQCWEGNAFFMTRFRSTATPEGMPCYLVDGLSDDHFITPDNACFPFRVRQDASRPRNANDAPDMFGHSEAPPETRANLSEASRQYLAVLGFTDPDERVQTAELPWMHALAIGYSPAYLTENADGIRQDWPRIPLPKARERLLKSAELGRRVAALLDTERPVEGVTAGKIAPVLRTIGVPTRVGGGSLDPHKGHLDVTAGWGHAGKGGVCMPGKGRIEERDTTDTAQKKAFGQATLDVYLNNDAYWTNIPRAVWDFHIGGYQVIKKWLSYRERTMLGRGLKIEEVEYVTEMVRRIAALILLQPELDKNYRAVKADTWPWPKPE
ncbi:MAG: N-6 DNA methylase [Verrucomicrobia bacterium]|nr:N-6 DNA methylase [Verrucomicrobiota bacterium]